jgi:NDP-sugar pyrophosphorylase family protein
LKFIKKKKFVDMPVFINLLKKKKKRIKIFHSYEDWADIGTHEELNKIRKNLDEIDKKH